MSYLQVLVPRDVAEDFADAMGRSGTLQLTDLNADMQSTERPWMPEIIRLQDVERQLSEIETHLMDYGLMEPEETEVKGDDMITTPRTTHGRDLGRRVEVVEQEVQENYAALEQQISAEKTLTASFEAETDKYAVLSAAKVFFANGQVGNDEMLSQMGGQSRSAGRDGTVGFKYLCGIIADEKVPSLKRQIFLTTRGNSHLEFSEMEKDGKYPFVVYYLGERTGDTLRKLMGFMQIEVILQSEDGYDIDERRIEVERQSKELERILNHTRRDLKTSMRIVSKKLKLWKIAVAQEKAIRVTLNKFREEKGAMLRCEGWCPSRLADSVQQAIELAIRGKGMAPTVVDELDPGNKTPPTYFETNKFTSVFQGLIDTYGTPRYREYNPTVPSIITFPFLFAMMYGDVFHGTIVFLMALYVVLNENRWKGKKLNELFTYVYGGRYLILFMGAFAIYNGFIYNDAASISMTLWSNQKWSDSKNQWEGVYPFGLDSTWHGRSNAIAFTNSMKMKLSVLFGVTQMSFGLVLKFLNHVEEGDYISLIWEFIPQLVFMMTFFQYMCFCIIYKWCQNWETKDFPAPSIITILVNMVLSPGNIDEETQLFEDKEFQATLQKWLAICMGLSVPVMLLVKPMCIKARMDGGWGRCLAKCCGMGGDEAENGHYDNLDDHHDEHDDDEHEDHDFGEVMIHQMIHTIEYVLGTISNTASYLRLWALSLAHAQLSEVFYSKTILEQMVGSGVGLFIGVSCFFGVTFAVLIVMDQLECFLHALRLHWVEFQNKFFYADGIPFEPFDYKREVAQAN